MSGIFFQRFMRPMAFKQEADEELIDKIINKQLLPILDYPQSHVPAKGFIFGKLCLADISLVSLFINAADANYQVDAERWPKFVAFMQRVKAHEVMSQILAKEAKILGMNA
ncbi:MAG: glutathione S-transferase [Zhongshania sp.]